MGLIYIFTNVQNGKQYIGKTTQSFNRRLTQHLCMANAGSQYAIHNALRKYGKENFHIECLQVNGDVNLWEKHLIRRWNTVAPNGYNLSDGGEGNATYGFKGKKHTVETRKRMSMSSKGQPAWNKKSIFLIHQDGTEEYFPSIMAAERKYEIGKHLSEVVNGKRKSYKGYRARYADEGE